jgi:hypothetical protein
VTREDADATLSLLRWAADRCVINPFGEHVWLKQVTATESIPAHITDCCPVDEPCERHRRMAS